MSNHREIQIIVNVIGKDNIMTEEPANIEAMSIDIDVSELMTVIDVAEEIKKRMLAIEDVL